MNRSDRITSLRETIGRRDADIDRLKAENESLIEQFRAIRERCYSKDKIIIELAGALDGASKWPPHQLLIEHAREATNEEG